jgi:hypothetical protein
MFWGACDLRGLLVLDERKCIIGTVLSTCGVQQQQQQQQAAAAAEEEEGRRAVRERIY